MFPQVSVDSLAGEKFIVIPRLDDPPAIHDEDAIRLCRGSQTVGHNHARSIRHQPRAGGKNRFFRGRVKCRRRLVEEHELRFY